MKKRQIIIVATAILILALGKFGKDALSEPKERDKPVTTERIATVFTDEVKLSDVPITINTTGVLEAKERMELFSEVQGLMLPDNGRFNAGNSFQKGETLIKLRADDAYAQVVSQRSTFERALSAVMADIRLDFPNQYGNWSDYLNSIDVESSLPPLPETPDRKLKSFLTGRDIYTNYHSVRNAEISLSRYRVSAPFRGVLTSANADPGTVVRPGQLLGVYIKPGIYELKASVDAATTEHVEVGQKVMLRNDNDHEKSYEGNIIRVNPQIDPATRMTDFFVEVRSDELMDGQFMTLELEADPVPKAYRIPRSAMKDGRYAFVVENEVLRLVEPEVVQRGERSAVIRGLENGDEVLVRLPPTVFDGMKVNVFSGDSTE